MENYSVVLFLLAIMIGLSAVADRSKIPYPVLLIIAGISIGFIPALPVIKLDSHVVFLLFLPPLLYDAAFNIKFGEFKTHLNTISTLAISLVFLSTTGIAVAAHYLIPGMNWPVSFVLGAILSATDAVAAIGTTKGLGLSHKTTTILEGESLVNDASALVAYRFAVAAVAGTAFIIWKAAIQFVVLLGGGFIVGFIMGKCLALILERVKHNSVVQISFTLLMPFVTYLVAEELHVSGVIAVVIIGLGISRFSRKIFPEEVRLQSKAIWDTIIFLLNGLIFILIGLQLPYVVKTFNKGTIALYTLYAVIITIVMIGIRVVRVFLQRSNLQRAFDKNHRFISKDALLDIRTSIIISWAGMRGIVSLAIAIGLPLTLDDGTPFPQRNEIVFISVMVVLITIVGQGLTLPWLVRTLNTHTKAKRK